MLLWYYSIPIDPVLRWLKQKFSVNPSILDASQKAFKGGFIYSETANVFPQVPAYHPLESLSKKGRMCRMISGNDASLLALKHVALKTNRPVLLASTSGHPPTKSAPSLPRIQAMDSPSSLLMMNTLQLPSQLAFRMAGASDAPLFQALGFRINQKL